MLHNSWYVKLILCCLVPDFSPDTKSYPYQMTHREVENFHYRTMGQIWQNRPKTHNQVTVVSLVIPMCIISPKLEVLVLRWFLFSAEGHTRPNFVI